MNANDEQLALEMERAARPDWGDVSLYKLGEREVIDRVEQIGYSVVAELNGYSVQRTGHQIGVFTLTDKGFFRWGWIETINGRCDLHAWEAFELALLEFYLDEPSA